MKYTPTTAKGQNWAGFVELDRAYDWEPGLPNVPATSFVGIEAALWTELVETRDDADYMLFPRLAGVAERAWTGSTHNFAEYRRRLSHHGRRLQALGVRFYRSPQVNWEDGS
jgi:hexosaminidase